MRFRLFLPVVAITAGFVLGRLAANAQETTAQPKDTPKLDRTVLRSPSPENQQRLASFMIASLTSGVRPRQAATSSRMPTSSRHRSDRPRGHFSQVI